MKPLPLDVAAEIIARRQHKGQTRWNKSVPYIVHPERIAKKQTKVELKAAAWLHDVVEDTPITLDELRAELERRCGPDEKIDYVIKLVDALTRREDESYLEYLKRIKSHKRDAVKLKIDDIEDNLADSKQHSKKGATKAKYELALWFLRHKCHFLGGRFS